MTTAPTPAAGSTWVYTPDKNASTSSQPWQAWQAAFIPDGFYLGYSVFTTFVWPQNKTCWVRASLKRLQNNTRELGLDTSNTPSLDAFLAFLEALALNEPLKSQPWIIRVTLVAHPAPLSSFFKASQQEAFVDAALPLLPSLCLLSLRSPATPIPLEAPSPFDENTSLAGLSAAYRHPLPHLKHGSLAGSLRLRLAMALNQANVRQEVLWLNEEDCFTEASTSNLLWLVKTGDGQALALRGATTKQALAGTTRQQVKLSAASLGIRWQEEALPQTETQLALGGFLLNATQGLRPLASLDGLPLPWPQEVLTLWQRLYTHWRENHL